MNTTREAPMNDEAAPISIEDVEAANAKPERSAAAAYVGSPTATWRYWGDGDTADRGVPDAWVWERLRNKRNALIAESDWRVVADADWDTAPWVAYRTALRDLPDTTSDPRLADWPEAP